MNTQQRKAKPTKNGGRHALLLQEHFNEQNFWACILILILCGAFLIWNPAPFASYRAPLSAIFIGTGLILVLTFLFRLRAYVQCQEAGLVVQLPFYRLTIPYEAIIASRPNEVFRLFPPAEQRGTQRHFLRWLWNTTVVVIELEQLPAARPWLRLWMSPYMLSPNELGLVLLVRDWIALRSDLGEFQSRHRRNVVRP
jgi:hypothetical protein